MTLNLPRTVNGVVLHEVRNLQQVTGLSVDRTNQFLHECGSVILLLSVVSKVSPLGLHLKLLVLATAVDSSVVLVNHVLTLGTVRLQGCSLHLLDSQFNGNHLSDAEERRLEDSVQQELTVLIYKTMRLRPLS